MKKGELLSPRNIAIAAGTVFGLALSASHDAKAQEWPVYGMRQQNKIELTQKIKDVQSVCNGFERGQVMGDRKIFEQVSDECRAIVECDPYKPSEVVIDKKLWEIAGGHCLYRARRAEREKNNR